MSEQKCDHMGCGETATHVLEGAGAVWYSCRKHKEDTKWRELDPPPKDPDKK